MEKYGVHTDPKTKTASTEDTCPDCGGKTENHGAVIKCAGACGTKPFEQETDGEEKEG